MKTKSKNKKLILLVGVLVLCIGILLLINNKEETLLNDTQEVSNNNIIAFRIQDGDNYVKTDAIPTSGYTFNENLSKCGLVDSEGNIIKDDSISITYNDNGTMSFDNINKEGIRCYVYFDKQPTAGETILANNGGIDAIQAKTATFSNTSCTANTNCEDKSSCTTSCDESTNGMYAAQDDDGTSYYFRGSVDNNWVKFGGFYWRIIRINGDGSIRLIYNGTSATITGETTQIGTSAFNENNDDNAYVGYKYTVGEVHGTGTDSTIKGVVDDWYNTNLNKTGVKEYIDYSAGFCNDRYPSTSSSSSNGSGGTSTTATYYATYIRLYTNQSPSLKCQTSSDLFTVSGAKNIDGTTNKGNQALTYPVGLITADEVAYGGGEFNTTNRGYWLYTGQDYWTMSPYNLFVLPSPRYFAREFVISSDGWIGSKDTYYAVYLGYGVRPVINLKADTVFSSGDGTSSNPYVVKTS